MIQAYIFAINFVTFLALKLIHHVISIRSIKNLDTGLYFCQKFGEFSSTKVDSTSTTYWVNKDLDTGSYFCHKFGEFSSTKVHSTSTTYWVNKNLDNSPICPIKIICFEAKFEGNP